jgi:hypothetical protein
MSLTAPPSLIRGSARRARGFISLLAKRGFAGGTTHSFLRTSYVPLHKDMHAMQGQQVMVSD